MSASWPASAASFELKTEPTVHSEPFVFSFTSETNQNYFIQQSRGFHSLWEPFQTLVGTGERFFITNQLKDPAHFFRVESRPASNLVLEPFLPVLNDGLISLPDAIVGKPLDQKISPAPGGTPFYELRIETTSAIPGIQLSLVSNLSAQAQVRISGNPTIFGNFIFSVAAMDGAGQNISNHYQLRVIGPPVLFQTTPVRSKAGEALSFAPAVQGCGPFRWRSLSGQNPPGIQMSGAGTFFGTPTAAAAERNESGLFTNVVEITDSFRDRLTGELQPQTTITTMVHKVRLSYQLNLHADRPNGPSFGSSCASCHDQDFKPDFSDPSATSLIFVSSGDGGECGTFRDFVVPLGLDESLVFGKITEPDCGSRMPQGKPPMSKVKITRVARWILELTESDTD